MRQYLKLPYKSRIEQDFTPLTLNMIRTLKNCRRREIEFPNTPYGPAVMNGSFLCLYNRDYIDIHVGNKSNPSSWFVTTKGLIYLAAIPKDEDPENAVN